MKDINELFAAEADRLNPVIIDRMSQPDHDAGYRLHYQFRPEPRWRTLRRSLGYIWQCFTLCPPEDFSRSWLFKRQDICDTIKVFPGDPRWDDAKPPAMNQWTYLMRKQTWPEGMGETLTETDKP